MAYYEFAGPSRASEPGVLDLMAKLTMNGAASPTSSSRCIESVTRSLAGQYEVVFKGVGDLVLENLQVFVQEPTGRRLCFVTTYTPSTRTIRVQTSTAATPNVLTDIPSGGTVYIRASILRG